MPQAIFPYPFGWNVNPMKTPAPEDLSPKRRSRGQRPACAAIRVAEPAHLPRLQGATRELCRSVGWNESAVFQAVIAVTELAHRLFVERAQGGSIELSAVRRKGGLELEVLIENDGAPELSPVRASLAYPLTPSPYS